MLRYFSILLIIITCLNAFASVSHLNKSISKKEINVLHAKKWFDFYYSDGREDFENAFKRGRKYQKTIMLILNKYGVPEDFYYLAMTESYFNNKAKSNKNAVGIWQFIPSTAKKYGMKVSKEIDERRHPVKSTIAAAKYLRDLYNIFQDWTLAAAAYNCGEYRVLNAIRDGNTRSFAELSKKQLLPKETVNYVSKFWVTREIDDKLRNNKKNSEDFYIDSYPVALSTSLSTSIFSQISEISIKKIFEINPDLENSLSQLPSGITIYLPKANAVLFNSFVKGKGVISKLKNPESIKRYGLESSIKGDEIKLMYISKNMIKVRNIRTAEETVISASELSKI